VIDRLYSFPELLLMVLPATTLVLLLLGLSWGVRNILRLRLDDTHVDFVMRVQITVFSMASLVLVFTLIQADGNYRRADDLVSAEASRVDQLDRLMARYGDARVAELRALLRDYTRSLIRQEWPTMLKTGDGDEDTTKLFAAISHRVLAIEPSTPRQSLIVAEMLKSLDSTTEARAARLNAVTLGLPLLYWKVVAFALLMLVGVASFAATNGFRTMVLAGQLILLGALVGFVFIMDRPFYGQHAIDSSDFDRALARMAQRTE
jgi:prepilin signal peptidase PulO-like enzyme (type II secretory pathway)